MRAILLALSVVLLSFKQSNGQSITFNSPLHDYSTSNPLLTYPEHKRIHGTGGVEVGLTMIGAGAVVLVAGIVNAESENVPFNGAEIIGGVTAYAGFYVFAISGIVYLVNSGRRAHSHHYSVTGGKNQMGIAYNFR